MISITAPESSTEKCSSQNGRGGSTAGVMVIRLTMATNALLAGKFCESFVSVVHILACRLQCGMMIVHRGVSEEVIKTERAGSKKNYVSVITQSDNIERYHFCFHEHEFVPVEVSEYEY